MTNCNVTAKQYTVKYRYTLCSLSAHRFLTKKLACLRKGEVIGEGKLWASPTRRWFPSPNFYPHFNLKRNFSAGLHGELQIEVQMSKTLTKVALPRR